MANWAGGVLTAAGRRLQAKAEAGTTLVLTRIKLGSGQEAIEEVDALTDLMEPETSVTISSANVYGDVCTVEGVLLASTLSHGFYCREWGVFANDPDEGEILYMVSIDDQPDWIPAGEGTDISVTYSMNIAVANATTIQANVDPTGLVDVDMLHAAAHALQRNTKYKAGDVVTVSTLPHGLVLEAQTDGISAPTLANLSGYVCGDTLIDGTVSWIVKRYVLTTDDEGNGYPAGESCVLVREITLPVDGWGSCTESIGQEYEMQIDIAIDEADETMFPHLALALPSLPVAGEAAFCPSIKACDGFIRIWAKRVPKADVTGVIALLSAPLSGGAGAHIFHIPATAWEETQDGDSYYGLKADIAVPRSTAKASPMLALDISSLAAARDAGICSTIQAFDGFVRLWAIYHPSEDIKGTITLFFDKGANPARLPTATSAILGGVKVKAGSGLTIDAEGNLSIDAATPEEVLDIYGDEDAQG